MRLAALVIAATLTGSSDHQRAIGMLNDWIAAVGQHDAGQRDAPLSRISAWSVDDLEMMRAYVEALAGLPNDNPQRATRRRQISGTDMAAIARRAKDLR